MVYSTLLITFLFSLPLSLVSFIIVSASALQCHSLFALFYCLHLSSPNLCLSLLSLLDVLIHLQYRIGRFVRIELTTFSSDYWLHLSEVAFDCRPLNANLTSGQVEVLFSRLGSQNGFAADASSSGTRYSMVHQSDGKKKSDSLATLVPAPHGHGSVSSWNTHWKLSLIVICLCAFGMFTIFCLEVDKSWHSILPFSFTLPQDFCVHFVVFAITCCFLLR